MERGSRPISLEDAGRRVLECLCALEEAELLIRGVFRPDKGPGSPEFGLLLILDHWKDVGDQLLASIANRDHLFKIRASVDFLEMHTGEVVAMVQGLILTGR